MRRWPPTSHRPGTTAMRSALLAVQCACDGIVSMLTQRAIVVGQVLRSLRQEQAVHGLEHEHSPAGLPLPHCNRHT